MARALAGAEGEGRAVGSILGAGRGRMLFPAPLGQPVHSLLGTEDRGPHPSLPSSPRSGLGVHIHRQGRRAANSTEESVVQGGGPGSHAVFFLSGKCTPWPLLGDGGLTKQARPSACEPLSLPLLHTNVCALALLPSRRGGCAGQPASPNPHGTRVDPPGSPVPPPPHRPAPPWLPCSLL